MLVTTNVSVAELDQRHSPKVRRMWVRIPSGTPKKHRAPSVMETGGARFSLELNVKCLALDMIVWCAVWERSGLSVG